MAEEELEEIEAEEPKKKGGKMLIIILLVVIVALGAGGAFVWFKFVAPAMGVSEEDGKAKEGEDKADEEKPDMSGELTSGPMYPIDPFILNLSGEGGKRFLKLTMELELGNEKLAEEITALLPKVKDSILILLSSKTFEDIYTVEGKFRLRNEITARINRFLVTGHIKNIYFTEFVIQ